MEKQTIEEINGEIIVHNIVTLSEQRKSDIKKIAFYFGLPEKDIWKVINKGE